MGLEVATLIHQLDPSNPVGATDQKSQGDDHMRMIKTCLKNNFPNFSGVVNSTNAELNFLAGLAGLSANVYTPVLTGVSNVTSALAPFGFYIRIGIIVVVAFRFTLQTTSPGASTNVRISIPIPSAFTIDTDAAGVGSDNTAAGADAAQIRADAANDALFFEFTEGSVAGTKSVTGVAMYRIK